MTRYASTTSVSVAKSKAEIETTLARYGADEFVSGWEQNRSHIAFKCHERFVKFTLPLPDKTEKRFWTTPSGRKRRNPEDAHKAWEQSCRQSWRALALCIKAKLEAVEAGITTFEDEFLAHIMLPNGGTVSQFLVPQLEQAYSGHAMPKALPLLEGAGA